MTYDPDIYRGAAAYYAAGRPPYSRALFDTLAREVGFTRSDRLLDVGCGPGILTTELAGGFADVVALDPDADMLAEGARRALERGISNIRWVQGLAENLRGMELGTFNLVTFGQSFHWTDRERVAEIVYDLLEPGGALALIVHTKEGRSPPMGPGYPSVPEDEIRALIDRYLGPRRRAGQGFACSHPDRFEDALSRTRFGRPREVICEGRPDVVQDADGVIANYLSTSFAAPHLFGDRLADFQDDVRALLAAHSRSGLYWNWPGDTLILLAGRMP